MRTAPGDVRPPAARPTYFLSSYPASFFCFHLFTFFENISSIYLFAGRLSFGVLFCLFWTGVRDLFSTLCIGEDVPQHAEHFNLPYAYTTVKEPPSRVLLSNYM